MYGLLMLFGVNGILWCTIHPAFSLHSSHKPPSIEILLAI